MARRKEVKVEEWKPITVFPGYSVSTFGRIRADKTDLVLSNSENQQGVVKVGMMRGGVQYHRSVPKLVAQAFIPRKYPAFDTPINVDGDRHNNHVENLMWRPRWFAIAYNRQFHERWPHGIRKPIMNMETGEIFENSWECAIHYGLIERDLVLSILNRTFVWPTYQQFRVKAD